ncbi:DUF1800 domain-containing protein [Cognatishimia sp. SS12]|uniref:DUF1800 domain-containing protein n=1 Tax=Cognatishimia sp. SS12 TaxID=2979465 RepID=UPI00232B149B|nr:DUF1800 domain-containing protein [Cognatishimia sp. SS12]MDC0738168.1 DUF1800 domain-containing protein [Cognatishimia sp. SS12]
MFDPEIAEIRFGTGLSPALAAPRSVQDMLAGLTAPDDMAQRFPIEPYDRFRKRITDFNAARRGIRRNRGTEAEAEFQAQRKTISRSARAAYGDFFRNSLLRRIESTTGLRERLAFFWEDHFTAHGKVMIARYATSPYTEEAIRPHIAGRFEDMLIAAVTHPLMLHYLDQMQSVGPGSTLAQKAARKGNTRGLNENLAREVLELHTLGVSGQYQQADVTQLAELFTGMTLDRSLAFEFENSRAEPGAETVLGRSYGGKAADLADITAALRDLARHPATAEHIAQKLARHFVADSPDAELVDAMRRAYLANDGALMPVYEAMLTHPASWQPDAQNVKLPVDFVASGLRALGIGEKTLARTREKTLRDVLYLPLQIMGQPWQKPIGPDGWPENNSHWITPQFLAARLQWALLAPQTLRRDLPDPRDFAQAALGRRLPPEVAFAAKAAENRWEGVALVLTAPAFQRQ